MISNYDWPAEPQAKDDFFWCESLIKIHSGSFYRAFKHLRSDKAKTIFAIYAFCRLADDAVDEHNDALELHEMAEELADFERGKTPDKPFWRALRLSFDRFKLDTKPYHEMLQGLELDLKSRQPADMEELERYCYLVAGTVGLMLCPLLAVEPQDEKTRRISVLLGHAMQLTNILRDVGTDSRLGRIYLPADLMREHDVTQTDLAGQAMSDQLKALWESLAVRAEGYYREVEYNLPLFERSAQLPVLLSLEYYRSIIEACRKAEYKLLNQRIFVPDSRKLLLYWRTRLRLWRK